MNCTPYREIWFCDFEFFQPDGEHPEVLCMVARELRSRRTIHFWNDELRKMRRSPIPTGADVLFVAYYASAEMNCYLALGWPLPETVVDLYAEFRNLTNGKPLQYGKGLLGALAHYGLEFMSSCEKEDMRALAMRGGEYSTTERSALLRYCQEDVDALIRLFPIMIGRIPDNAMLRGRFMKAAARMEFNGIPMDRDALLQLRSNWGAIQDALIEEVDRDFGVFDGRTFKQDRFRQYLTHHRIPWPQTETGQLVLDEDTFRQLAKCNPELSPLRELRHALSQLRLSDLSVGGDSRNRCMLSAFSARTSRNQPSNTKFAFGPSAWLRGLIKPEEGMALAYVDWSQQEFGIAAALSADPDMLQAYTSGDPYLSFAKLAGAVPPEATKASHKKERELYKQTVLATQYCMGPESLSSRLGITLFEAKRLLNKHCEIFRQFWKWSDAAVDFAMLNSMIYTAFGWTLHVTGDTKPRSLRNFPMQANGAEMLRIACCLATERGIRVCAPVHDALLIEAPVEQIEAVVSETQAAMREASRAVLNGFALESDAKIVRFPYRYMDERGEKMWQTVMKLLPETGAKLPGATTMASGNSARGKGGNAASPVLSTVS